MLNLAYFSPTATIDFDAVEMLAPGLTFNNIEDLDIYAGDSLGNTGRGAGGNDQISSG